MGLPASTGALSAGLILTGALCYLYLEEAGQKARVPASLLNDFARPVEIPFPKDNPYTVAKAELGKLLFFDPRLSRSRNMACATCHRPEFSWTDGLPRARGRESILLARKTPTLLNAAWGWSYFWDGRAHSLEEQALIPIQAHDEMDLRPEVLLERLTGITGYRARFANAFPDGRESADEAFTITLDQVAKAIATYERTIVSSMAPFDRYIRGERRAISDSARRGFELFTGRARCVTCHSGWRFTNESFADIGLPSADEGRGAVLDDADLAFAFKTPTLRNIARRAPYMHDGSLPTLRSVLDNYNNGGTIKRLTAQRFLEPLHLNEQNISDLVAFLETLTSEDREVRLPSLPK